jgi:hypothetical protein
LESIVETQPNANPLCSDWLQLSPRSFHPPNCAFFCFLERNQEVPDRAVWGCSVSRSGKISGMTPDFDRARIKFNPSLGGIAPFASHDERQERQKIKTMTKL